MLCKTIDQLTRHETTDKLPIEQACDIAGTVTVSESDKYTVTTTAWDDGLTTEIAAKVVDTEYRREREGWESRANGLARRISDLEVELVRLDEKKKQVREDIKDLTEAYRHHLQEEPTHPGTPEDADAVMDAICKTPVVEEKQDSRGEGEGEESSMPPWDEATWTTFPSTDLPSLADIKGLGKKHEKLIEACPTLGHLETMRAKPGAFTNVEGIGKTISERICEYCADIMMRVNESGDLDLGDQPAAEEEEGAAVAVEPGDYLTDPEMSMEDVADALLDAEGEAINYERKVTSVSDYFQHGSMCYLQGKSLSDCPENFRSNPEVRADWLRGYLKSQAVSEQHSTEDQPGK